MLVTITMFDFVRAQNLNASRYKSCIGCRAKRKFKDERKFDGQSNNDLYQLEDGFWPRLKRTGHLIYSCPFPVLTSGTSIGHKISSSVFLIQLADKLGGLTDESHD